MGMKYEIDKATIGRETRAVKAIEDPILMSDNRTHMPATSISAGIGICRVGWTWRDFPRY